MSVQSQLNRIKQNINNALTMISTYGVQVQNTDTSNELASRIAEIANVLQGFVKYTQQTLTDIQKQQARENINAASLSDIPTIPTNISAFNNDVGYLTQHQDISGKQDKIDDLSTIRNGAALGASALQRLPSNAVTTDTNQTIDSNKIFSKPISGNTSIVWNQLISNGDFHDYSVYTTANCSYTVSNNVGVIVTKNINQEAIFDGMYKSVAGHKYYTSIQVSNHTSSNVQLQFFFDGNGLYQGTYNVYPNTGFIQNSTILNNTTTGSVDNRVRLIINANTQEYVQVKNYMVMDLTQMFGVGNEPTLEQFESMFPLDYYEYNTGSTIEKALLVGSNLNAPVLYEGGQKLSDKYNVNLGYKTLEELKDALKAIW